MIESGIVFDEVKKVFSNNHINLSVWKLTSQAANHRRCHYNIPKTTKAKNENLTDVQTTFPSEFQCREVLGHYEELGKSLVRG